MHFILLREVPGVSLIPHTDNQFAAVKEGGFADVGNRVGFMPYHELEGIELAVKDFMPFTNQVVAGKDEDIAGR